MARIDRLEAQIERQQKRDKAARLLAARAMLKRRQPHGLDVATRGHKRVAQVIVDLWFGSLVGVKGGILGTCNHSGLLPPALLQLVLCTTIAGTFCRARLNEPLSCRVMLHAYLLRSSVMRCTTRTGESRAISMYRVSKVVPSQHSSVHDTPCLPCVSASRSSHS